tara:strand:+ start:1306 stop:3360 length:2055 start_codon:yes stop_codon:yes gene_type:complete
MTFLKLRFLDKEEKLAKDQAKKKVLGNTIISKLAQAELDYKKATTSPGLDIDKVKYGSDFFNLDSLTNQYTSGSVDDTDSVISKKTPAVNPNTSVYEEAEQFVNTNKFTDEGAPAALAVDQVRGNFIDNRKKLDTVANIVKANMNVLLNTPEIGTDVRKIINNEFASDDEKNAELYKLLQSYTTHTSAVGDDSLIGKANAVANASGKVSYNRTTNLLNKAKPGSDDVLSKALAPLTGSEEDLYINQTIYKTPVDTYTSTKFDITYDLTGENRHILNQRIKVGRTPFSTDAETGVTKYVGADKEYDSLTFGGILLALQGVKAGEIGYEKLIADLTSSIKEEDLISKDGEVLTNDAYDGMVKNAIGQVREYTESALADTEVNVYNGTEKELSELYVDAAKISKNKNDREKAIVTAILNQTGPQYNEFVSKIANVFNNRNANNDEFNNASEQFIAEYGRNPEEFVENLFLTKDFSEIVNFLANSQELLGLSDKEFNQFQDYVFGDNSQLLTHYITTRDKIRADWKANNPNLLADSGILGLASYTAINNRESSFSRDEEYFSRLRANTKVADTIQNLYSPKALSNKSLSSLIDAVENQKFARQNSASAQFALGGVEVQESTGTGTSTATTSNVTTNAVQGIADLMTAHMPEILENNIDTETFLSEILEDYGLSDDLKNDIFDRIQYRV